MFKTKKISICLFLLLQFFSNCNFVNAASFTELEMISGTNPELKLYIHNDTLRLDLNKNHNIRLKILSKELFVSNTKTSSFKINTYEIDGADRNFIASQNTTITRKNIARLISIDLGYFSTSTKNLEFDLYNSNQELINTYRAEIEAFNLSSQKTEASKSFSVADCEIENFDDCQMQYLLDNLVFEVKPQRQITTRVVRSRSGFYKVTIPVARNGFQDLGKQVKSFKSKKDNDDNDDVVFDFSDPAYLTVKAGDGDNPGLKFEAGILTDEAQDGAIEYDGKEFYITTNGTRAVLNAQGPQGEPGSPGAPGLPGAIGPQGPIGSIANGGDVNSSLDFTANGRLENAYLNGNTLMNGSLQFLDGNQSNGFVLVSDVNGIATWQNLKTLTASGVWVDQGSYLHARNNSATVDIVVGADTVAAADIFLGANGNATITGNIATTNLNATNATLSAAVNAARVIASANINGATANFTTGNITNINSTMVNGATFDGDFTNGSILFSNLAGEISEDNARLSWDTVTNQLVVNGKILLSDGTQANNNILISDANGLSTWQAPTSISVANASTLDGIDSLQFLRADTSDSFTGTEIDFSASSTLDLNGPLEIADTNISLDGSSTTFTQSSGAIVLVPNGGSDLDVNLSGAGDFQVNTNHLFVDTSRTNVGIGNSNPSNFKLEVTGSIGPPTTSLYDLGSSSLTYANAYIDLITVGNGTINHIVTTDVTTNGITMPDGAANGFVLTTDANGFAYWANVTVVNNGSSLSQGSISGAIQFRGAVAGSFQADEVALFWDDAQNRLGLGTNAPAYSLDLRGDAYIETNGTIGQYLIHDSDTNTSFRFQDDDVEIRAGNELMIDVHEDGSQDFVMLGDGGDIDVNLNNDLFVEASTGNVSIGSLSPSQRLDVTGSAQITSDIHLGQYLYHDGDTDTYLRLQGDSLELRAGGETMVDLHEDGSQDVLTLGDGGDIDIDFNSMLFLEASNGNLGIATTTPANFKLEVNGNVGPNANSTHDLGSIAIRYANIFSDNFNGASANITAITTTTVNGVTANLTDLNATTVNGTNLDGDFTNGSVLFSDNDGIIIEDNTNLAWDNSNKRLGIGLNNPQRVAHISDTMRLEPRSVAPSSPGLGDIYVDSDSNELCFYDGSAWVGLKAAGACI